MKITLLNITGRVVRPFRQLLGMRTEISRRSTAKTIFRAFSTVHGRGRAEILFCQAGEAARKAAVFVSLEYIMCPRNVLDGRTDPEPERMGVN